MSQDTDKLDKPPRRRTVVRPRPVVEQPRVLTREEEQNFDNGEPEDEHDAVMDSLGENDDENTGHYETDTEREVREREENLEHLVVAPPVEEDGKAFSPRERRDEKERALEDDFSAFLVGLDFTGNQHSISITREEPEYDPATNRKIKGFIGRFSHPIDQAEIQQRFGGGRYRVLVYGPLQVGGRKRAIKWNKLVEIAGDPIVPDSPFAKQQELKKAEDSAMNVVRGLMANQERATERIYNENQDLKKLVISTLATPKNETSPILDLMREDNRRRDEERKEDQRRQSEDRKLELERMRLEFEQRRLEREEDRKREEKHREDENRRWEAEQKLKEQAHQKEMELIRLQMKRQEDENKAAREEAAKLHERMEREKAESTKNMMTMMQNNTQMLMTQMATAQQSTVQQMQQVDSMKTQLFMDMVKAKGKEDPLQEMLKLKQVMDVFQGNSGDADDKATWEKVLDRISDAAPGIAGMVTGLMQQRPGVKPRANPGVIRPGSEAVVELPAPPTRKALPPRKARTEKPATKPAVPVQSEVVVAPQEQTVVAQPETPPETAASKLRFPTAETDRDDIFVMLVEDLEHTLHEDWPVQKVFDDVLMKFPEGTRVLLASMTADDCLAIVAAKAPADWLISSLKGTDMIEKLHALNAAAKTK